MGLTFVKTCEACPEQYDVFDENAKQAAYVRIRGGTLRADAPNCGGKSFYLHVFDYGYKGAL